MFKFKLQKVLDYRKQLEDQAALELSLAKLEEQRLKDLIVQMEKTIEDNRQSLSKPHLLSGGDIWLLNNHQNLLFQELKNANKQLIVCQEQVDLCQQNLIEKSKEHALLCKLKEKQAQKYYKEEQIKEQRVYDETATIRHGNISF